MSEILGVAGEVWRTILKFCDESARYFSSATVVQRWPDHGLSMGGVNNWDQNPRFPYRGGGIYFISKIIVFALTKMGVGASSTEVPITVEAITLLWRRFRHRDLGGSIRLDALHVIVLFVRPYAAYKGQKRSAPVRLRQWCSAPASARASASAPHRLRRTRPAAPPSPVAAPGGGPRE